MLWSTKYSWTIFWCCIVCVFLICSLLCRVLCCFVIISSFSPEVWMYSAATTTTYAHDVELQLWGECMRSVQAYKSFSMKLTSNSYEQPVNETSLFKLHSLSPLLFICCFFPCAQYMSNANVIGRWIEWLTDECSLYAYEDLMIHANAYVYVNSIEIFFFCGVFRNYLRIPMFFLWTLDVKPQRIFILGFSQQCSIFVYELAFWIFQHWHLIISNIVVTSWPIILIHLTTTNSETQNE